jgi:starch phosphorylase
MNEGHAAFLTLELIREKMAAGKSLPEALSQTKAECIFTTHTPVEAGHDRFSPDLMDYAMHRFRTQIPAPFGELMKLGRVNPQNAQEPFCMTVLALKLSRAANAVSELHGRVSRHMWHCLYPEKPVEQVPIGHITNGIHLLGWMKGTVRRFWQRKLATSSADAVPAAFRSSAPDWAAQVNLPDFWQRLADHDFISDEELWALRFKLRRELIEFARRRLLIQGQRLAQGDFIAFDQLLNPDALTIGFARRFATYKRAPLIFQQLENVVRLARDKDRPIQFIFAGKAHPRDDDGKRYIQHVIHLSKYSDLQGHMVFIENYDVHVARQMVSGCDVWLNNPRRPLEASGTSGQKVVLNGGLNLSVLDGWWAEAYDGLNGFAIGTGRTHLNTQMHDDRDAEDLHRTLRDEVIPLYYHRDRDGLPREWIKRMKRTIRTLGWRFNADRMVMDYTLKGYIPAAGGTSCHMSVNL